MLLCCRSITNSCCCSITNSDCVTRSDLSGIRGSKLLCLPLEVGDMTDRVVTNVDFDPEGIRRITVAAQIPEPMAAPTWERWSRMAAAMTTVGGRR